MVKPPPGRPPSAAPPKTPAASAPATAPPPTSSDPEPETQSEADSQPAAPTPASSLLEALQSIADSANDAAAAVANSMSPQESPDVAPAKWAYLPVSSSPPKLDVGAWLDDASVGMSPRAWSLRERYLGSTRKGGMRRRRGPRSWARPRRPTR